MSVTAEVFVAILGLISAVWIGWMTYRGVSGKNKEDSLSSNFSHMQKEIDRLRDDLDAKDTQARSNHDEIILLRSQITDTIIEVHKLRSILAEVISGATVLYTQLVANEIAPLFGPRQKVDSDNVFKET